MAIKVENVTIVGCLNDGRSNLSGNNNGKNTDILLTMLRDVVIVCILHIISQCRTRRLPEPRVLESSQAASHE